MVVLTAAIHLSVKVNFESNLLVGCLSYNPTPVFLCATVNYLIKRNR